MEFNKGLEKIGKDITNDKTLKIVENENRIRILRLWIEGKKWVFKNQI